MKRVLVLVVLVSMTAQLACRLGVASYLYQQRHQIAYGIGLITEIPIAMCNGNYHFDQDLKVQEAEESSSLPVSLSPAGEIILFVESIGFELKPVQPTLIKVSATLVFHQKYSSPALLIFHPPA